MTEVKGVGAVNVLEAVRIVNAKIRFYQASTNEMSLAHPPRHQRRGGAVETLPTLGHIVHQGDSRLSISLKSRR
jgi:hypothetical protein